ncbi:MAG: hypothetical protein ACHQ4H_11045, partial [Ktedonobacterales bacterium]
MARQRAPRDDGRRLVAGRRLERLEHARAVLDTTAEIARLAAEALVVALAPQPHARVLAGSEA